ncbi:uncharacterized protein LOC120107531 [Phoenix dactylifera]|uniref:Uncharacterized protein LOC103703993 n=1 Tax=Phoenix dactylifera TaxID=42345 RepID=A0A8B8ZT33_PHODC|nr:uncharacterized protein LOC103703993 [Phoenix dactylifera]XP_038976759.1 uncharacterized protein LOC120107531 [Phoenix dactylifera]
MSRPKDFSWVLAAIAAMFIGGDLRVGADTMVTGSVFCDQCKDGHWSLFDYPLDGAKVAVTCGGADGQMTAYKEDSTNWLGCYTVRFEGNPDLSGCYARVVGGPEGCGAGAGPARGLTLMFRMFGMAMYTVDPLLSQPPQPMGFCPRDSAPPSSPTPMLPRLPPPPPVPRRPPGLPSLEASACSYDKWMMPQFKCYWKVVSPQTRVAMAFGPIAAGRYGMNMTLWEGLQGRGDLYRTLLREGTAALLNSYDSLSFFYPTLGVIDHMNRALLGSSRQALTTALRFRRANSGAYGPGNVTCNFNPCS